MFRTLVTVLILIATKGFAQITVINTGTSEHIFNISKIGDNVLISGFKTYLVKCYGECNSIIPLVVPTATNSAFVFTVTRPDSNTLYMNSNITWSQHTVWKSVDCGMNWSKKVDTFYPDLQITRFFDTINGVSFCGNFTLVSTNNGFTSFSNGSWPNKYPWVVEADGDSTVTIGDQTGGLSISYNRGSTWHACTGMNLTVNDVKFYNKDTLFAITDNSTFNYDSCFARSYDKGLTWDCMRFFPNDLLSTPAKHSLRRLHIKSHNEIYVLAYDYSANEDVIFKTSNMGYSWAKYVAPFSVGLNDMKFLNDSIAIICGNSGLLFKWNKNQSVFTTIIETSSEKDLIRLFPNPTCEKQTLSVKTENVSILEIELYDLIGRKIRTVYSGKVKGAVTEIEFDVSNLSNSVYTYHILIDGNKVCRKLIKQ
ncbi:MAG: T9SS type A sorting domain-containing protein [Bacteroidia bacterium]|jgi:hypothetical protein|nr:T9SS type A sorting domain-containing protein [Bacteroidia bacterium]